ncbi:hypothetical protein ACSLBF_05070 [Pseudoalteromonas sp. T1lg65]|uniref:hypothetical protein n=1 Tax=Pseudoalteromonas sp. T1lg65 TaxID=2077101 RepID=UPI003F7A8466
MTTELIDAVNALSDVTTAHQQLNDKYQATHDNLSHNHQSLVDWQTQTGETTFKDLAGNTHQVPTLKSLIADAQSINPNPHVMTKAQFDALREMRKQQYAGSGFVEWGKASPDQNLHINHGMYASDTVGFQSYLFIGRDYKDMTGVSKSKAAQAVVDGVVHSLNGIYTANRRDIECLSISFPPAPDGTKTYDSATGTVTQHSNAEVAFASETDTNKVITSRKDLVFLESWHEKIADKDVVYPLGNVQYGASSYKGVGLLNNLVEQGYSTFGEWDQNTKGYGAKWSTLTDEQKATFLGEPEHNIYYDPEAKAYVQVRYRMRVIEGVSDAWRVVRPNAQGSSYIKFLGIHGKPYSNVAGRFKYTGNDRDLVDYDPANYSMFMTSNNLDSPGNSDIGRFITEGPDSGFAIPIALVQRLNQGAYHPSYNPMGTGRRRIRGGYYYRWYEVHEQLTPINSTFDCFNRLANNGGGNMGELGFAKASLGLGYSGRPDQYKFHDTIYAGQVEDLRLNANKLDVNQLRDDTMRKAVAGTLRGKEKVPFTKVKTGFCHHSMGTIYVYQRNYVTPSSLIGKDIFYDAARYLDSYPKDSTVSCSPFAIKFIDAGDTDLTTFGGGVALNTWLIVDKLRIANSNQHLAMINQNTGNYLWFSEGSASTIKAEIIFPTEAQSAEFDSLPWVDIIGSPENIAATFPDGVIGQWIPEIPDGSTKQYSLNRKSNNENATLIVTYDNGQSWSVTSSSIVSIKNCRIVAPSSASVELWSYQTSSAFTEPAQNSMLIGKVGDVYASTHSNPREGNRLTSSLTGLIGKATLDPAQVFAGEVAGYRVVDDNKLNAHHRYQPKHGDIAIPAQGNHSPLVKSLYSTTEKNGLLYLQFHGAELKHNGTDWGDDQTIPIIDGENVKTDLNGNTVKVFCHHTQLPIGIAHNG